MDRWTRCPIRPLFGRQRHRSIWSPNLPTMQLFQRGITQWLAWLASRNFRLACFHLGEFPKAEDLPSTLTLLVKRQTHLLPGFPKSNVSPFPRLRTECVINDVFHESFKPTTESQTVHSTSSRKRVTGAHLTNCSSMGEDSQGRAALSLD